jgi:hypothetical protein
VKLGPRESKPLDADHSGGGRRTPDRSKALRLSGSVTIGEPHEYAAVHRSRPGAEDVGETDGWTFQLCGLRASYHAKFPFEQRQSSPAGMAYVR